MATAAAAAPAVDAAVDKTESSAAAKPKLHGRAFYESLGSPKYIVAPMVDQSEFAWRLLTRSFLPPDQRSSILAYSPMLHARHFADGQKYRDQNFQPTRRRARTAASATDGTNPPSTTAGAEAEEAEEAYLDGNPALDRPLIVQFCANDPAALLAAAKLVAPHCDAVDLNLGCPQGIARRGRYGAFLQEDQDLVFRLVRTLRDGLPVPVTAKIRILDTPEATLAYARTVLDAGASFLAVHGRRREQKGHLTGLADWAVIRYLRDHLPPDTVLFANGNVLQPRDLERCLAATGADAVMSAEGNLSDPALFAPPPAPGQEGREYWRARDGRKAGWRVDAVARRYLDVLHRHVLGVDPPARRPLFLPGDDEGWLTATGDAADDAAAAAAEPPRKKRKRDAVRNADGALVEHSTNLGAVQPHLFHLLRHLVTAHTDVRDALARAPREGGLAGYERVLAMTERKVAEGLLEYERTGGEEAGGNEGQRDVAADEVEDDDIVDDLDSSASAIRRCRRPWWVAQPIVRPAPKEALAKGAVMLSKKEKEKMAQEQEAGEGKAEKAGGEKAPPDTVEALGETTSFQKSELVSG